MRKLHAVATALWVASFSMLSGAQASVPDAAKNARFSLSQSEVARGQSVTVSWSYTGRVRTLEITTSAVTIEKSWRLPARNTGSFTFVVSGTVGATGHSAVGLTADGVQIASADLYVTCAPAWFFAPRADECPTGKPQRTQAAVQRFEHGTMSWFGLDREIVVRYDRDSAAAYAGYSIYDDTFVEGAPETDPAIVPPGGRQQPKRGFGVVWRANKDVRARLGWALDGERGYSACVQRGYVGWKRTTTYFSEADQSLIQLSSDTGFAGIWTPIATLRQAAVVIGACG